MKHFYKNLLTFTSLICMSFATNAQSSYLDQNFGTAGIISLPLFRPSAVAFQQDGKILVTGSPVTGNTAKIYRFNTDGSADLTFGSQGSVAIVSFTTPTSVTVLADNKILLVGSTYINVPFSASGTLAFARLNTDGSLDTSFGTNGVLRITEYASQSDQQKIVTPTKIKFLPDGSIVAAGRIGYSYPNPLAAGPSTIIRVGPLLTRLTPSLTLDTAFNGIGYLKLSTSIASQFAALGVCPDGSVIGGLPNSGNIRLYKFSQNGAPDLSFGTDGLKIVDIGSSDDKINDITVQPDGKILISGSRVGTIRNAYIARLTANGDFDTAYGNQGIVVFANSSGESEDARQTLLLNDGKVLTGLYKWNTSLDVESVYTKSSGAIDIAAGNNGRISADIPNHQFFTFMAQQTDGKIVMTGTEGNTGVLMRFHTTSTLDTPNFIKDTIKIFPNPAQDQVTISGMPDGTSVVLCNISGQKLREIEINGDTRLDISMLAPGMYILKTPTAIAKILKR